MPKDVYEVVAQAARYLFLFLMLLIVWRSWRWYRKDQKQMKKRRKLLPDAGYVGEMIVIKGDEYLAEGTALPVAHEGTLGFGRSNDLCVPVDGVAAKHLWFRYDEGRGLMVEPMRGQTLSVDGAAFQSSRHPLYMGHGSCLQAGQAMLRLRLFAGFEVSSAVQQPEFRFAPDPEPAPQPQPPQPDPAQQAAYEQWLQQQWVMQEMARREAYQQGWQQAMAQQQQQQGFQPAYGQPETYDEPAEEETVREEFPQDGVDAFRYEDARRRGMVDHSAFMRPAGEKKPDLPQHPELEEPTFYPPVMDEEEAEAEMPEEEWVLPAMDAPPADELPRSAYVGEDEAHRAKKQVWDRYFGGGQR